MERIGHLERVPRLRMNRNRNYSHRYRLQPSAVKRICIVGLPNSGKTQLCNSLTGAYALVSNYPQTTVEITTYRCTVDGEDWEVTDTPGLHGLYIQSEEEMVVRARLFTNAADVLVQCVDANRFRESLLLSADLLGLGLPLILVLTAVGESARHGRTIETRALARIVGAPVVSSPRPGAGIPELRRLLRGAPSAPHPPVFGPDLDDAIEHASTGIAPFLPAGFHAGRAAALLLLENDPSFGEMLSSDADRDQLRAPVLDAMRRHLPGMTSLVVGERRARWVDDVSDQVATRDAKPRRQRFSETFASMCRHPIYGLPILAFFLALIYVMVVQVAGALSLFLTTSLTDPLVAYVGRLMPNGFWKDMIIGPHGLLTLGLFNSLTTVLPILAVFFMVFGLLEDIGYLPNLAILTRRIAGHLGITGNAVIPLVLGFGCKTMATMTARNLSSRKEKLIVVSLIAFAIPCSAQMGLSIAILGQHGVRYFLLAFGFLGIIELAAGLILNRVIPGDTKSDFIQELPPIRLPHVGAVARKTGYRLLWFLKEAIPIFLIAALAMFAIEKLGILALLKKALEPFMTQWLGLPLDMVDALLLTLARSEAAAGMILRMARAGELSGLQSVVAVVLLTTFAQCFANIAAMFKEVGARAAIIMVVSIYCASLVYTGAVHAVLTLAGGAL